MCVLFEAEELEVRLVVNFLCLEAPFLLFFWSKPEEKENSNLIQSCLNSDINSIFFFSQQVSFWQNNLTEAL